MDVMAKQRQTPKWKVLDWHIYTQYNFYRVYTTHPTALTAVNLKFHDEFHDDTSLGEMHTRPKDT